MNIKNIRRNYDGLTMLERLSLADNAISRGDESEITAIIAASPKESFRQVDYFDLMREIKTFRLCNLIVRLGYIMHFDFFLRCDFEEKEGISNDAKLAAYLYVRATDSWKDLNDELALRPNFEEELAEHLFAIEMLKMKEILLREIAFTEDEARAFIKDKAGIEKMQTIEDEKKAIREALGLPEK
jgi:hypothetical protein